MHEGKSICKHINNSNRNVLTLKIIDVIVDDKDQSYLPKVYDKFLGTKFR